MFQPLKKHIHLFYGVFYLICFIRYFSKRNRPTMYTIVTSFVLPYHISGATIKYNRAAPTPLPLPGLTTPKATTKAATFQTLAGSREGIPGTTITGELAQLPATKSTVFSSFCEELWEKHKDQLTKPRPSKFPQAKAKTGMWCKYHSDGGHNTNDCIHLRDALETLHREGKLPGSTKPTKP